MVASSTLPSTLAQLLVALEGLQSTKYLLVACFCLLCYEYLITLPEEFRIFWHGRWTWTRILFFFNRYVPPLNALGIILWYFMAQPTHSFCYVTLVTCSTLQVAEVIVIQGILIVRVFHLWSHKRSIQAIVLVVFFVCLAVAITVFGVITANDIAAILPEPLNGCFDIGSKAHLFWVILVPTFAMETVLFVLTLLRTFRPIQKGQDNPLLKCLVRDGTIFYLAVVVCVGFAAIGGALPFKNISLPAVFSGFVPAVLSILSNRLLFNLHSLAAEMARQPTFILNNLELSRLDLRKGGTATEFFVDCNADDLDIVDQPLKSARGPRISITGTMWSSPMEKGDWDKGGWF